MPRKIGTLGRDAGREQRPDGIGPRLAAIREGARIGQAELARRLEISRFVLNRWERGQRSIAVERLGPWCHALGADPSGVLGIRPEIPLPSVNHRLLQLFRAEGTETAGRRLDVDLAAMNAIMAGKLMVAESMLEGLADAYGVSYAWLLTGKPEHWAPPMATSWSSRLRFFRVSIGGFYDLGKLVGGQEMIQPLENLFRDGERSESEAESLLKCTKDENITGTIRALRASNPEWSNSIKHNFPYDFNGLVLDKPQFKTEI